MIILLTKDEDETLAVEGLKDIIENNFFMEETLLQTGLSHQDLKYFVDVYVLEEGRKSGRQVSRVSHTSQTE